MGFSCFKDVYNVLFLDVNKNDVGSQVVPFLTYKNIKNIKNILM